MRCTSLVTPPCAKSKFRASSDLMRFCTFLFDLDGTIVDAFTTIHRAYVHTLPQLGLPAPTMAQVRRAVGGGLTAAMRHFVSEAQLEEAIRIHQAYSEKILLEDVVLLPGTLELLRFLRARGAKIAVLTNKHNLAARRVCEHLGVTPLVDGVFGAKDTPWLKPQPELSAHVLAALGAEPATTLLVGDSPFDVQTARNGGFVCWAVTTGTHTAEELRAAGAEAVFPSLSALQRALAGS
jgi:HAD superfamily hydrolase (TIGR01509 family)